MVTDARAALDLLNEVKEFEPLDENGWPITVQNIARLEDILFQLSRNRHFMKAISILDEREKDWKQRSNRENHWSNHKKSLE